MEYIYDYYMENKAFPSDTDIKNQLLKLRDIIAYRIVISLPKCNITPGEIKEQKEITYLYEIANMIRGRQSLLFEHLSRFQNDVE